MTAEQFELLKAGYSGINLSLVRGIAVNPPLDRQELFSLISQDGQVTPLTEESLLVDAQERGIIPRN